MRAVVTGATGFLGGHVARQLAERGDDVVATYRNPDRLARLRSLDIETVKADMFDRAALRRAVRRADVLFHTAGYVGSRPLERVWQLNARAPRLVVEAAAVEDVPRVVVTSSVAAIGPAAPGEVATEADVYRGGGPFGAYGDSKHEGEAEAFAAGARLGVEVITAAPAYVLGVPLDPTQPGETSTRTVGNYLLGRLPGVVDGGTNIVDVDDVARGHLLAAEHGRPGERYILGGVNLGWVELIDRIADLSGVHRPIAVLPTEVAVLARAQAALKLPGPIAPEALQLMAQNWRCSSEKARKELRYRSRPLEATLRETIDWYAELIDRGVFAGRRVTALSVAAAGMRAAQRFGFTRGLHAAERYAGRRLVAGA
jgi:dihydroflavonol-4-reductase